MFPQLFPEVPEDLAALGDEALAEILSSFRSVSAQLRAGEINLAEAFGDDVSETDASAEAMRQWQQAAESVTSFRAEIARRDSEREAFAETAATLDAVFAEGEADAPVADTDVAVDVTVGDTTEAAADEADDEADAADEDAETETVAEDATKEAVTASGTAARIVRFPAVAKRHEAPETADGNPVVLVAAGGLSNARVHAGSRLNESAYAEAAVAVARSRGPVKHVREGGEERILVASADFIYPDERKLRADDPDGNARKVAEAGSYFLGEQAIETLMASGGICAPPTPIYTLPELETTERPVKNGLPSFSADRGGVALPHVNTIGDISTAISVIEEAADALGGTFATKSCQNMPCTDWTNTFIGVIAHCREVGNLNARTWPEGVAKENQLTMAALARTAEGRLLDKIDTLSIAVTGAAVYGASSSLLYRLQLSRVGIISRLRLPKDTRFTVILPFWAAEMFSADIYNGQESAQERFGVPADAVAGLLSKFGFNVIWHLDQGIAGGATAELFAAQSAGAGVDWPGSTVIARLFPAGMFLHLDGGTLELGVVRDSTLNSTNDYELFGELFENVARVGPAAAAHRIAITACPNGTVAPYAASAFTCSAS